MWTVFNQSVEQSYAPYLRAQVSAPCVPTPQMKALCEGYPNMIWEWGAETGINEQMVHFVCVLIHRRCKCGLCSTKVLNKVTSISPRPGLCPMRTHPSNESPLRGLSEYVFGIGG